LIVGKGTDFRKLIEKDFGQMKFDMVGVNPPYGGTTGEKSRAVPIYQRFVNSGFKKENVIQVLFYKNDTY